MRIAMKIFLAFAAMGALAWTSVQQSTPDATEELQPYSMQLHLHASMSEGGGSMRGANVWAKDANVDILWWTDHDWRVSYHTYISGFGFEADDLVSTGDVPYTDRARRQLKRLEQDNPRSSSGYYRAEFALQPSSSNGSFMKAQATMSQDRAIEGTRSLMLHAASGHSGNFSDLYYTLAVSRRRDIRSLASNVRLHISIYPDSDVTEHTIYGLDVTLSQQPPSHDTVHLRYVLTNLSDLKLAAMNTPTLRYVKLPYTPDAWNTFDLNITRDAATYGLGGADNSLSHVSFGMELRQTEGKVYFDDYRISHDIQGPQLLSRAREMAVSLTQEFGIVNYIGQEFSYQAHLNGLGDAVPMLDYDQFPLGLDHQATSDFIQKYDGVSMLNHIYGTSRPPKNRNVLDPVGVRNWEDEQVERLTASRVFGADMLEVGYPIRVLPFASHLRVWDAVSTREIYVTGTGTSDTHSNSANGWTMGNNFVTWVWSKSKSQADLMEGMRLGRCYFGDPAQFQGALEITTPEGYTMGQIVVTNQSSHQVNLNLSGLMEGATVRAVVNGDIAEEWTATGTMMRRTLDIRTTSPTYVRLGVYRPDGKPLVFSNPLYFTNRDTDQIPTQRKVLHQ